MNEKQFETLVTKLDELIAINKAQFFSTALVEKERGVYTAYVPSALNSLSDPPIATADTEEEVKLKLIKILSGEKQ